MQAADYVQGDAFQAEKRTMFSAEWLPLCAEGQVANPGDFIVATVGGWGVVGVRGEGGAVHVLRNACRHQNMQVVAAPSGNCKAFRCRFHGWTYDLQGRFVGAPPPVAPKDSQSPANHLASLAATVTSGIVFFSLATPPAPPAVDDTLPAYGGTLTTEIGCNWKVCVEHLLGEHTQSADFTWTWPLLGVRRAGSITIMEQVVPHTFLRTRLLTHVFGDTADQHGQFAAIIKRVCERLQADRGQGVAAAENERVGAFHARLAQAYAQDQAAT